MGMTITEKIIAKHAGRDSVKPGDLVLAEVDLALANDITAPVAIDSFKGMGARRVHDASKIVLVPDHFIPAKDIRAASQYRLMEDFSREHGIEKFYPVGEMGIEHVLLTELGLVKPGDLIIGADSHTCTYGALGAFATGVGSTDLAAAMALGEVWLRVPESMKLTYSGRLERFTSGKDLILLTIKRIGVEGANYMAMEFGGQAISELPVHGRLTMANMAIEAGAKNGIFHVDDKTEEYLDWAGVRDFKAIKSDEDAAYAEIVDFDAKGLQPQVAAPHLPSNVSDVGDFSDIEINQVVIGSCTNGRIEDLREADEIIAGKKVRKGVRVLVFPGTQGVLKQAVKEGIVERLIDAGVVVSTPTCGPCLGGHMGILDKGERAVSTTNRNFVGRMGHPESEIYLCGPYVAAASAITGRITHPEDVAE